VREKTLVTRKLKVTEWWRHFDMKDSNVDILWPTRHKGGLIQERLYVVIFVNNL
jgi:hypothetical protein